MSGVPQRLARGTEHVAVLPLADLFALPDAPEDRSGGIYCLWLRGELRYIGKGKDLKDRKWRHEMNRDSSRFTPIRWNHRIDFDKFTCLVLVSGDYRTPHDLQLLQDTERAYLTHYDPPENGPGHTPNT